MLGEGEAQELWSVKSLLQDWDDNILKTERDYCSLFSVLKANLQLLIGKYLEVNKLTLDTLRKFLRIKY